LVLSLILGAFWLGSIKGTRSTQAVTPPEAPAAGSSAVLTASERLEASAGGHISFPIALDGTDGVPSHSIIAVKGLPHGSNFSEGRPFGDSEWTLRTDQIGDLHLVLPDGASGEFKLAIALIAPDESVLAEAETLLQIAPAPVEEPPSQETSAFLPGPSEGVAPALIPDGSQAGAAEAIPDAGIPAVPDPGAMAATAPSAVTPSEQVEQPSEAAAPGDTPPETAEQAQEAAAPAVGHAQPSTVGRAENSESASDTVRPSVFVNLREAPSSSASVLGVVAKGVELSVLDRKRGWVQVTDPRSGKKGWIYSGLLAGEAKASSRGMRIAPAAEAEPKRDSVLRRLGRWLNPWSDGN
jgi:hypothetical protein